MVFHVELCIKTMYRKGLKKFQIGHWVRLFLELTIKFFQKKILIYTFQGFRWVNRRKTTGFDGKILTHWSFLDAFSRLYTPLCWSISRLVGDAFVFFGIFLAVFASLLLPNRARLILPCIRPCFINSKLSHTRMWNRLTQMNASASLVTNIQGTVIQNLVRLGR